MRVRHCCRGTVVPQSMSFEGPLEASLLLLRNLRACRTGTRRIDRLVRRLVEIFEWKKGEMKLMVHALVLMC